MNSTLLLLLTPLILIELALQIVALIDLWRRNDLENATRWVWTAVILLVSTFGPILYLLLGRTRRNV